jgi:hypothetical protein
MNGFVLKGASIEQILAGKKTWEIRSVPTRIRGTVALIKSGSGRIVATCRIADCMGPLTLEQLQANTEKHQIPSLTELPTPKPYAWVLADVKPFAEPIPVVHSKGGTWVTLTPENVPNRFNELEPAQTPAEQPKLEVTVCCPPPQPAEVQPAEVKA